MSSEEYVYTNILSQSYEIFSVHPGQLKPGQRPLQDLATTPKIYIGKGGFVNTNIHNKMRPDVHGRESKDIGILFFRLNAAI